MKLCVTRAWLKSARKVIQREDPWHEIIHNDDNFSFLNDDSFETVPFFKEDKCYFTVRIQMASATESFKIKMILTEDEISQMSKSIKDIIALKGGVIDE